MVFRQADNSTNVLTDRQVDFITTAATFTSENALKKHTSDYNHNRKKEEGEVKKKLNFYFYKYFDRDYKGTYESRWLQYEICIAIYINWTILSFFVYFDYFFRIDCCCARVFYTFFFSKLKKKNLKPPKMCTGRHTYLKREKKAVGISFKPLISVLFLTLILRWKHLSFTRTKKKKNFCWKWLFPCVKWWML